MKVGDYVLIDKHLLIHGGKVGQIRTAYGHKTLKGYLLFSANIIDENVVTIFAKEELEIISKNASSSSMIKIRGVLRSCVILPLMYQE